MKLALVTLLMDYGDAGMGMVALHVFGRAEE